jgi:thioredoxin reductase (NADPH)
VLIATGIEWRRLGIPRLEELVGAGVYYGAAAAESRAMEGRDVFVVGGGNSAGQAALHLARDARSVTVLVRRETVEESMSSYLVRAIDAAPNVKVRTSAEVVDGHGRHELEGLRLADRATGETVEVSAGGLFIMIGGEPHADWLPAEIASNRQGYLLTGRDVLEQGDQGWPCEREPLTLETSVPGVFAAGDVRHGAMGRVAAAVGEGATVVRLVHEYMRDGDIYAVVARETPRGAPAV